MLQFEFNGHTSDEYGLIVTRIEENDTLVNRSLQLGEKNKYRPKENQFGTLYSDNYSFKMGVMRNPCRNKNVVPELKNGILKYDPTYTPYLDNGILKFSMNYTTDIKNGIIIPNDSDYLTSNNIRIINAWLTSPQYPRLELNFVKDIVQRVIESHPSDLELINGDTLMSYNKRGAELQRKYAALANEMAKEYIPEYLEGHQYSWIIPNNSDEMTITIKCNCEIPELEGIA